MYWLPLGHLTCALWPQCVFRKLRSLLTLMSIKIIDSDRGLKMSSCSLILIKTGLDQGTLFPTRSHMHHRLMSFCWGLWFKVFAIIRSLKREAFFLNSDYFFCQHVGKAAWSLIVWFWFTYTVYTLQEPLITNSALLMKPMCIMNVCTCVLMQMAHNGQMLSGAA